MLWRERYVREIWEILVKVLVIDMKNSTSKTRNGDNGNKVNSGDGRTETLFSPLMKRRRNITTDGRTYVASYTATI